MSDVNYEAVDDDVFANFVKQRQEAQEREEFGSSSGFTGEYEQIKYCAAPKKGGHALVRFVGNPPKLDGTNIRPTDCIERHISKIKDDAGKIMYLILPCRDTFIGPNDHIMWRIISEIKRRDYIGGKKVYINEINHPDIWNLCLKGGFVPEDEYAYTYADGWDAKRRLLINCIDRLDDWCKENKHTKIFSKNVSVTAKGEFAEMGVKSFGFVSKLQDNLSAFQSWEKYDTYIVRPSSMKEEWKCLNGTFYKSSNIRGALSGITDSEYEAISTNGYLTDEEKSYERYDLEKHFKITSYQKLYKRLGKSIEKVDEALGTTFLKELKVLAEKERKDFIENREEELAQQEKQNKIVESQTTPVESTPEVKSNSEAISFDTMQASETQPVARSIKATENPSEVDDSKFNLLAHFKDLSGTEKALFKSVVMGTANDGKELPVAEFIDTADATVACPRCGFCEPASVTVCASCGAVFG